MLTKKLKNFPLTIHPLFLLLGVYCYLAGKIITFFCYTLSALIHEFGHFVVAKKLGYKLLKVRLLPYGAELCGNLDEFLYKDEIWIALAGPITSVILSLVIVSFWWINPNLYNYTLELCISSIVCGIFNLLPIFPLDGGRVLVSVLSLKLERAKAIKYASIATRCFAICLLFIFFISVFYTFNITFGILGIMLLTSSINQNAECNYYRMCSLKEKILSKEKLLNVQFVMVNFNMPIFKVMRKIRPQTFYNFIVVDDDFNELFIIKESVLESLCVDEFKKPMASLYTKRNFVIKL